MLPENAPHRIPTAFRTAPSRRASALGTSERKREVCALCSRVIPLPTVKGPQLGRPIMRRLIATIALLALVDTSVAIAQTVGSRNQSAPPPSTNPDKQLLPEAPVGHRQPRADQVPSEKDLMDPNDPINRENAALDRMVKGICRGC